MTNEQVGLYIRMICAQHQHGGRIDTNVLRTQCDSITGGDTVYSKFEHDERGSYNARLEIEMQKRREKADKARASVNKRWGKHTNNERNTNVLRSESESENEIVKEKKGGAGGKKNNKSEEAFEIPTLEQLIAYADEKGFMDGIAYEFFEKYTNLGWKKQHGGEPVANWKLTMQTWMKRDYNAKWKKPVQTTSRYQTYNPDIHK